MFIEHSAVKLLVDPSTSAIIEANFAAAQFYGYTVEELQAMNVAQINVLPPDSIARSTQEAYQRKTNFFEFQHRLASGEIRDVEIYSAPINVGGHMLLYSIIHDITKRKQAEDELRESEDKFKHIFDHSIIGKSITKLTGEVQVNQAFYEMLGYSSEEFKKYKWQEITHPEDIELTQKEINALLSGEKKSVRFEKRFIHKNGSIVWIDLSSTLRLDADGKPLYLVTDLVNITERKRVEIDLLSANKALTALHDTLREQAFRDELTGLYNRRLLFETFDRELARAKRHGYPVSVIMIDIDYFKDFNDTYGHQAGDEVLISLGTLLQNSVRQGDVACRYGGEEFLLILPSAQISDAMRRAEDICRNFQNTPIKIKERHLTSTVSAGIGIFPDHGSDATSIIKAADQALYRAKEEGRNCVRLAVP
jgi:diguanylate cyclase (GGDEF)-like protein/PAS domain S-box-containing protein